MSPPVSIPRLLNVSMRGLTMASSFALTFALARYLQPAKLALYGLFGATIVVAIYAVGLDFYTYTTREIIRTERQQWGRMFKGHIALALILYAIVAPFLSLLFLSGALPWSLAGWLAVLLPLEHLARELNRILIATSQQLLASAIMFVRKGIWAWCVIGLMFFDSAARELTWVFGTWVIATAVSCLLGILRLHRMRLGSWRESIDWPWIYKGVRISGTFLAATLAIQALSSVDKYWQQSLVGRDALAAYVLFSGIAVGMSSVLDAGVFSFAYPRLIEAHHRKEHARFQTELRKMLLVTLVICAGFSVIAWLTIDELLRWINKPVYIQQKVVLPWVLLATSLSCISYSPHYGLYARGQDRVIIASHFAGALLFVAATWMLSQFWRNLAVPVGLCCAFGFILILKSWFYLKGQPTSDYRPETAKESSPT